MKVGGVLNGLLLADLLRLVVIRRRAAPRPPSHLTEHRPSFKLSDNQKKFFPSTSYLMFFLHALAAQNTKSPKQMSYWTDVLI